MTDEEALDFIKGCEYALGLVEHHTGSLLHAVLYEGQPTSADIILLEEEMEEDDDFQKEHGHRSYFIMELSPDMIATIKSEWV